VSKRKKSGGYVATYKLHVFENGVLLEPDSKSLHVISNTTRLLEGRDSLYSAVNGIRTEATP